MRTAVNKLGVRSRLCALGGCVAAVALTVTLAVGSSAASPINRPTVSVPPAFAASGANVAAAKAIVAKLSAPVPLSLTQLDRRPPTGKSVVVITCSLPVCQFNFSEAIHKLKWKFDEVQFDASNGPQAYVAAWEQALQRRPNYILEVGIYPPTLVSKELAQAQSEHIAVIGVAGQTDKYPAFKACIGCSYYLQQQGIKLADIAIADGATGSSTVSLGDKTNYGTVETEAGMNSEFARLHAGGAPQYLDLSLEHSIAENNAAVIDYIQSHPGTNKVLNTLPDLTAGLPAALKQAGLSGKVTYDVSGPQEPDVAAVRSGAEGPAVAVYNGSGWWSALGQAVELSVGKPTERNGGGWIAVLTRANAARLLAGSTRPDAPHYQQAYLSSWDLG